MRHRSKHLTAFHVYCLANMLRRPIIVYQGDDDEVTGLGAGLGVGGGSGGGVDRHHMRGIYLPTLLPPEHTYPFPLTVCYSNDPGTSLLVTSH